MPWPFPDPPETPVLADAQLIDGTDDIYLVQRTADGQWRFRSPGHLYADAGALTATTLGEMAKRHPLILQIAPLEPGHHAWRPPEADGWVTAPAPQGPTHFIQFEGFPDADNAEHAEFGGAFINCWVRAPSLDEALAIAAADIEATGWTIGEPLEAYTIERADYTDDQQAAIERFDQAQIDGEVYEYNTYPLDDRGMDDDE
jgi:hypothetical protein